MRDWMSHTSESLNPTKKLHFSINQTNRYMISRRKQTHWSEFVEAVRMHIHHGIDYLEFSMASTNDPEFGYPI